MLRNNAESYYVHIYTNTRLRASIRLNLNDEFKKRKIQMQILLKIIKVKGRSAEL